MSDQDALARAVAATDVPAALHDHLIDGLYAPALAWTRGAISSGARIIGVQGLQGTGKSTLSEVLAAVLRAEGLAVVVLSLDDCYLTKDARQARAAEEHALFATRGVPGTHDVALAADTLRALRGQTEGTVHVPRFDKAVDDRGPDETVAAPVDVVFFEGWCVGVPAEPAEHLPAPLNALERDEDAAGAWRGGVNARLEGEYAELWAMLDALMVLRAPGFDAARRWRQDQENALRRRCAEEGRDAAGMSDAELARFMDFFERLSRWALAVMPERAGFLAELDAAHRVTKAGPTG